MSVKFVFLFFGTLSLAQCNRVNPSRESVEEYRKKLVVALSDNVIVSLKKNFVPIINDLQDNKIIVNPNIKEKLEELKTALDEAIKVYSVPGDNMTSRAKFLTDFFEIYSEIEQIHRDITDPTDGDKAVGAAFNITRNHILEFEFPTKED